MQELLFGDSAAWFTVPAIIGSVFFMFRMVMLTGRRRGPRHGLDLHSDVHVHAGGDSVDMHATHGMRTTPLTPSRSSPSRASPRS